MQKNCQEINIKNIFTNFEILLLIQKFPTCHRLLIYRISQLTLLDDYALIICQNIS